MRDCNIESIWFEFENWATPHDEDDSNSDVVFKLSDGTQWVATFITYQNILSLSKKNKETGECLNGLYFVGTDMVLIEKLNRESVIKVLEQMLKDGNISKYFSEIKDY